MSRKRGIEDFRNVPLKDVPHGDVQTTWEILSRIGFDAEIMFRLRSSKEFQKRLARGGLRHAVLEGEYSLIDQRLGEPFIIPEKVSLPMDCYFSLDDWQYHFDIPVDIGIDESEIGEWIAKLKVLLTSPCPFVEDKYVRETHFLYCLPELHNLPRELRCNHDHLAYNEVDLSIFWSLIPRFSDGKPCGPPTCCRDSIAWRQRYSVLDRNVRWRWYLMFKGVLPGSLGKTFLSQSSRVRQLEKHFSIPLAKIGKYQIPYAVELEPAFTLMELVGHDPHFYHTGENDRQLLALTADIQSTTTVQTRFCLQYHGLVSHLSYDTFPDSNRGKKPPAGWGIPLIRPLDNLV
ncbi:hypothetical protein HOB30_03090 [Candidatus Falkowbacteria bacterium]|jgi:hypothetical protein|nr:hypothetical protein [Candidatus Falkowbacteria bacterium]